MALDTMDLHALGGIAERMIDDVREMTSKDEIVAVLPLVPTEVYVQSWYESCQEGTGPVTLVGVAVTRHGGVRNLVIDVGLVTLLDEDDMCLDHPATWWKRSA